MKFFSNIKNYIYFLIIIIIIFCFIFLEKKYTNNGKQKVKTFADYYTNVDSKKFELISMEKLMEYKKNNDILLLFGDSHSEWSKKYIYYFYEAIKELDVPKVYYYDLNNAFTQKNSYYYRLKEMFKGSLISGPESDDYLCAPCFFIISNGKVKYYNYESSFVKNGSVPEEFWNYTKVTNFKGELLYNLNKYYLNK